MDNPDEVDELGNTYRRKRGLGTILGATIVLASTSAAWFYVIREPSPKAVCRSIYRLVEDQADQAARQLASRVADDAMQVDDPKALFAGACGAYFDTIESDPYYAEARYGRIARCVTTSFSAESALECVDEIDLFELDARVAARQFLGDQAPAFPERQLTLPEGFEGVYDPLVSVSEAALAQCDELFDVDEGCYGYTWSGEFESKRELGKVIPGPIPEDSRLVLLEASCGYDAGKWVERHPQLIEQLAASPIPVQKFACNYLPTGDPSQLAACNSWQPPFEDASVGLDSSGASVWVSMGECANRFVRIDIARSDSEGRSVELHAFLANAGG